MNLKYNELQSFLRERSGDPAQSCRAISVALGLVVGRQAAMPTSMPTSPNIFYGQQIAPVLERQICDFNEQIVVDLDVAMSTARAIWLIRAGLCHPTELLLQRPEAAGNFFCELSGAAHTLSPETAAFLEQNRDTLFTMANRISTVLRELAPPGDGAAV